MCEGTDAPRDFRIAVPRQESTCTDALTKSLEDSEHPGVRGPRAAGPLPTTWTEQGIFERRRGWLSKKGRVSKQFSSPTEVFWRQWRGLLPHAAFLSEFTRAILC